MSSNGKRKLNEKEQRELLKLARRRAHKRYKRPGDRADLASGIYASIAHTGYEDAHVEYQRQGDFTICLLHLRKAKKVLAGASKRCTYEPIKDEDVPERGEEIAFSRAAKAAISYVMEA